jgi:hypothetical protein
MGSHDSVIFSFPLINMSDYRKALLNDRDSPEFDRAHREAGAWHVMTWVHPEPPYAIIRWQGPDVLDSLARTATSQDPFMARWRGLIRMYSGPEGAGGVWDSSRHQVFLWELGEEGPEADIRIFHGTSAVHEYIKMLADINENPALQKLYDRIRRQQGVTRVEIWHQQLGEEEVVMRLVEGHDLDAAFREVTEEKIDFDQRINRVARAGLEQAATSRSQAELIVNWKAESGAHRARGGS